MDLKKGDKVMRVGGGSFPQHNIYTGQVYTVREVAIGGYIYLKESTRKDTRWQSTNFKKVSRLPDWF